MEAGFLESCCFSSKIYFKEIIMSNGHGTKHSRRTIREHMPFEERHLGDYADETAFYKNEEAAEKADLAAAEAADRAAAAAKQAADESAEKNLKDAEDKGLAPESIIRFIENMMKGFLQDYDITNNMTGVERQRLFGAGVRNFGFIEKAYDIAAHNPTFLPAMLRRRRMRRRRLMKAAESRLEIHHTKTQSSQRHRGINKV
jgi:hypothetical protein